MRARGIAVVTFCFASAVYSAINVVRCVAAAERAEAAERSITEVHQELAAMLRRCGLLEEQD